MKYSNALVIGKFMPFHIGHNALIEFAMEKAMHVDVLVLGHKNEPIPLRQRFNWVKNTFIHKNNIEIKEIFYDENKLDSSSESNVKSSIEWCEFLKDIIKHVDVIIGSEDYVKYMADYLKIDYIIFDKNRDKYHISGTDLRNDLIRNWDYLMPTVKQNFVKHICICGSESTGKTTVCNAIEKEFEYVTAIPEIGRCLVGNSSNCSLQTLQKILKIHKELIESVMINPPTPIILWDTDNLTTLSYISFLYPNYKFNTKIKYPKADIYYFFESDIIPYENDITRLSKNDALLLSNNHKKTYEAHGINLNIIKDENRYEIIKKNINENISNICNEINKHY